MLTNVLDGSNHEFGGLHPIDQVYERSNFFSNQADESGIFPTPPGSKHTTRDHYMRGLAFLLFGYLLGVITLAVVARTFERYPSTTVKPENKEVAFP